MSLQGIILPKCSTLGPILNFFFVCFFKGHRVSGQSLNSGMGEIRSLMTEYCSTQGGVSLKSVLILSTLYMPGGGVTLCLAWISAHWSLEMVMKQLDCLDVAGSIRGDSQKLYFKAATSTLVDTGGMTLGLRTHRCLLTVSLTMSNSEVCLSWERLR